MELKKKLAFCYILGTEKDTTVGNKKDEVMQNKINMYILFLLSFFPSSYVTVRLSRVGSRNIWRSQINPHCIYRHLTHSLFYFLNRHGLDWDIHSYHVGYCEKKEKEKVTLSKRWKKKNLGWKTSWMHRGETSKPINKGHTPAVFPNLI